MREDVPDVKRGNREKSDSNWRLFFLKLVFNWEHSSVFEYMGLFEWL